MFTSLYASLPDYVSIERRKVKWARVEVAPNGQVRLIVPRRMSRGQILELYGKRSAWVAKKRSHFAELAASTPAIQAGQALLWGEIYTCVYEPSVKRARIESETKQVICPPDFSDSARLNHWHRQQAAEYLRERIHHIAHEHGFSFNRLSIRNQKTRWGSCSSKKNISLNWRLIKAPVFVSDYVIIHELAHTRIMNHSGRFWGLVEEHFSRYQEARAWLKDFGHTL